MTLHPELLVSHYWERTDAQPPARRPFTWANWYEAMGINAPDWSLHAPRPISRGIALALVNVWNRAAAYETGPRRSYWLDEE